MAIKIVLKVKTKKAVQPQQLQQYHSQIPPRHPGLLAVVCQQLRHPKTLPYPRMDQKQQRTQQVQRLHYHQRIIIQRQLEPRHPWLIRHILVR